MCGCCSSQCPAGLIQAYRFIFDSRDRATQRRLENLNDAYRLLLCRTIMNGSEVCPNGLEPAHAIEGVRLKMLKLDKPAATARP
jgi:succinate dehydrogenase / fumarate reductase iron-sulfur subunit